MKITVNEEIHLSEIRPSDQAACLEYLNEKEIYERIRSAIPYPYTEADFQSWMQLVEKQPQRQGRPVQGAIRDRNGSLIGGLGFDGFQLGKSHRAKIGYWLAKPYWGRGMMTAVVRCACDFAFAEFSLVKITAHVFADNAASARCSRSAAFSKKACCVSTT